MRKHIFGFALFALILSSAIFAYRLIYSPVNIYEITPPDETPQGYNPSMPVIQPDGFAKDIYAAAPASVVVDVNSKKLYAGVDDKISNPLTGEFVKVVVFAENSGEAAFQTNWLQYINTSNVVFRCDECASMTAKKNYYARIYFAKEPDDATLNLRLKNEKSGEYHLQSTAVLVNSGKNK
jgi:hypothetical protein